ncbi:SOSEKI 5-like protein [Drosera capensis]
MAVVPRKMRSKGSDDISPERTKVWTEPNNKHQHQMKNNGRRRVVHVVYYLSRNGQLEHPHFIEVPLSAASDGLFLRDVISRLNLLRGKGMGSQYSWSSKRSYKNGYVWHDLEEEDFIHPVQEQGQGQGQDYVLKGSQIILQSNPISINSETAASSSSSRKLSDIGKSDDDQPVIQAPRSHRRNQSWSSIHLQQYKVYKSDSTKSAADASTQTDEIKKMNKEDETKPEETNDGGQEQSTELNTEQISPPPSDSSPETLETLMKADGRRVILSTFNEEQQQQNDETRTTVSSSCPSGRMKASSVFMSLISCGSTSFRDHGVVRHHHHRHHGLSLVPKPRLSRGGNREGDEVSSCSSSRFGNGKGGEGIEEYYSGSLVMETKKDEFQGGLKRSSSYNADRLELCCLFSDDLLVLRCRSMLRCKNRTRMCELAVLFELAVLLNSDMSITEEMEGMRAKCIPRKPKSQPAKMLINSAIASSAVNDAHQDRTKAVGVE